MLYFISMAKILWARSIPILLLAYGSLNRNFILIALLLNSPRSPVLVVTLTTTDMGIRKSFKGKYREICSWNSSAPVRARRPPGIRLVVSGISRDTSWQV